ncbi:cysteine desulfurase family protein [Gorillibacterium sp. sgz5001074]|uniref:cysteine desulfurase family protein n=1 Tax=Gorillibacterium sp. sgz5001074 TaxID=3446695 RepID=UPI003F66CC4A
MNPIYLDHAAATPLLPEVLDAMLPLLREQYGNPSSLHRFGREARSTVTVSRDAIARFLGCSSKELIFTGGGTESDNLALFGTAVVPASKKNHIITTAVEHHAVLHTCSRLEKLGYTVTYLPVDTTGLISLDKLRSSIRPETLLISMMYGNNEVGAIQPIAEAGSLAREHGVLFHVDAVQALGMEPIDLSSVHVDLMSFSAHKIGGPRGVGALYCSSRTKLEPQLLGGSQERKKRAGTENPAGIAGFAEAVKLAHDGLEDKRQRMEALRSRMIDGLVRELGADGFVVNGPEDPAQRLPHILNVSFPGCSTETLLMNLDLQGVAAASGSACTSGSLELSHVLVAMGLPPEVAGSAVRFSFGSTTNAEEIDRACQIVGTIVNRLRK